MKEEAEIFPAAGSHHYICQAAALFGMRRQSNWVVGG